MATGPGPFFHEDRTQLSFLALFTTPRELRERLRQQRTRLYRIAYSWCHDEALAEDLVQDTLTRALERAGQLRDLERFDPWLFAILANRWRDHLRSLRPHEDIDTLEDLLPDGGDSPERADERGEIVDQVRAAIARLSIGQRQVLTLVDLEEFSYAEVSHILEIPIGTVMSRLCRARRQLRTELISLHEPRAMGRETLRRIK